MRRGFEVNLAQPVEFSFILETIAIIVALTGVGVVLVKKHPKAARNNK
jgi:hypothetical protein